MKIKLKFKTSLIGNFFIVVGSSYNYLNWTDWVWFIGLVNLVRAKLGFAVNTSVCVFVCVGT